MLSVRQQQLIPLCFHVEIKELKKEGEELSVGLWKEKMETWMMLMVQKHFGDGVRASRGDLR